MPENQSSGFPTRSDTNQAVQLQKQAIGLKIRIKEEEELYYPSSGNKGTDQLRSYCLFSYAEAQIITVSHVTTTPKARKRVWSTANA